MVRNKVFLKTLAFVFIIEMLSSSILPSFCFALTAGPTAPEATSFEPVDTTDMVNLLTGDFTYNLPLLEVPGPAGNYPLSLSYHAGIDPEEDASWVGLGWTLNPGSISRLVNGYADDLNGPDLIDRVFWEGGEQTTYTIGVSVGVSSCATVSAGLSFAQDTYEGFGMGAYIGAGLGVNLSEDVRAGLNGTIGISPYGGTYSSAGIGVGIGKTMGNASVGGNIGVSLNSEGAMSAGIRGGVSAHHENQNHTNSFSLAGVGASISSQGPGASFSVAGFSGDVYNSKQNNISTTGENFAIDIPLYPVNISLGRSYVRYWIDEKDATKTFGSLYFPTSYDSSDLSFFDDKAFDAYHSFKDAGSLTVANDPETVLGGSFADYDHYSVNAQGISGVMRPYHYRLTLFRQNKRNGTEPYQVKNYNSPQQYNGSNTKIEFRFVNDFANKITYDPPLINVSNDGSPLSFPTGTPVTGLDSANSLPNVPGSRNIQYFTNEEILNTVASARGRGFMECRALGFERSDALDKGTIGAFTMTNTSGVNYHFSLPAYSYDEYTYSANASDVNGKTFNTLSQPVKYAYTWYLTAITGPDYVDRNGDGYANEGDWGYWVSFNYGKWTDCYRWRNPGIGFNKDLDRNFNNFSKGKKEIYYLNSIKTASHTAFFVKELRWDGKSANALQDVAVDASNGTIHYLDQGAFEERHFEYIDPVTGIHIPWDTYPASLLKLKAAYVFANDDVEWTDLPARSTSYTFDDRDLNNISRFKLYGENVLDVTDLLDIEQEFKSKAVRSVYFETDYSLTKGVPSSYISSADALLTCVEADSSLLGKLTLKSVDFRGKGDEESLIPKIRFEYDVPDDALYNINPTDVSGQIITIDIGGYPQLDLYEKGDLLYFEQTLAVANDSKYYGYILDKSETTLSIQCLESAPLNKPILLLRKTKNPPYVRDMDDVWRSYKVDFNNIQTGNAAHLTTRTSGQNADVWSMRKIQTGLGSTISVEYESDTYSESVYNRNHSLIITSLSEFEDVTTADQSNISFIVTARFNAVGLDIDEVFSEGQSIDLLMLYRACFPEDGVPCLTRTATDATVVEVGTGFLRLKFNLNYHHSPPITVDHFTFYGGNIFFGSETLNYGGGIRVKSVSISDQISADARQTAYEYEFDGISSGVTSYVPLIMDKVYLPSASEQDTRDYKFMLYKDFADLITLGRSIPAPAVMYGRVRVREKILKGSEVIPLPQYSEYEFETYNKGLVGKIVDDSRAYNYSGEAQGLTYTEVEVNRTIIKDYSARLGNLKKITLYSGEGQKINETINHYLHDNLPDKYLLTNVNTYEPRLADYHDQGVIQETFNHGRFIKKLDNNYRLLGIISKKESYPSVQVGSTVTNFKTGIKTESTNHRFDFYTGEVLEVLTSDGYGNYFLSEKVPAYTVYDKMGAKNRDTFPYGSSKKHMLVQAAAQYIFKVDDPAVDSSLNKTGVVAATVSTWAEDVPVLNATFYEQATGSAPYQVGVWRKKDQYVWVGDRTSALSGDGLQPFSEFTTFDFSNASQSDGWQKVDQITLYDVFSHPLEAIDMNGNFAATKMSYNQERVFATAANSQYNEFAYSGAEEDLGTGSVYGGGVLVLDGLEVLKQNDSDVLTTHTGSRAIQLSTSNQKTFEYSFTGQTERNYHASVWVNSSVGRLYYSVDGTVTSTPGLPQQSKKAGGWYLVEVDIPSSGENSALKIWCATDGGVCNFDDFRVCPTDASMVSYVYNEWGELSHILDDNNLYTEYRYDGMGRLTETFKESFQYGNKKTADIKYHYAAQQ